jgi:putative DNA primase/helicase
MNAPEMLDRLWTLATPLRVVPESEKFDAFRQVARRAAALVGDALTQAEVTDRLQALAEINGLVGVHGQDAVQAALADAFSDPAEDEADAIELRPPELSDDALALDFAEQHHERLRYVAIWGNWLEWDGCRWTKDGTLKVLDLARKAVRIRAANCAAPKVAIAIASAKTIASTERLARSDRKIAATSDQWDADPWSLNTPRGAIDLRTGAIRPSIAADYATKITSVGPDDHCDISVWLRFLNRVTGGDKELAGFLQRMSGYALTGDTSEHALFFIYGTGANGKSTFLNALTGCLGDYHRTSAIETFTASKTERHPTDLAGLRGARLVTAIETEEGRQWAESKIKSLTGGDRIAARFMRQDFFEFTPAFKLIIAGNHKPGLRSVDEAIRRRFHLVPFTITVPPEERDGTLPDQLRAEWPGILAWALEGCLEWRRQGLAPPAAVREATAAYLEAEDALAAWIDDQCHVDPDAWESSSDLFRSFRSWADRCGEYHGSQKKFIQRLDERGGGLGLRRGRDNRGVRGFYGLRIVKADLMSNASEAPDGPV